MYQHWTPEHCSKLVDAAAMVAVMLTLLDDCAFSGDEPFIGQQKPPCRACITARAQEAQAGRKCSTLNVGRRLKLM
jgi:hypothetical protein